MEVHVIARTAQSAVGLFVFRSLPALCEARGWEFICSRVRAVNSKERTLVFEDDSMEPLPYDVLSVNCGSSTLGELVPNCLAKIS